MTLAEEISLMNGPLNIILIEDDDGDAKAIRRAFGKSGIANPIHRMRDGVEGLAFLRGELDIPPPEHFVILLDVNMPRMNGIELLTELRADPQLRRALVVVLTTSDDERDIIAAYDANVAGYILKRNAGFDFLELVGTLNQFWKVVVIPAVQAVAPNGVRTG
ncbi:response regulator [Chachezhania sediminis]|uniref:response regulator n=1 Tax=Chachezhania sediminis TaxID=2599291 RepID=UPI001E3148B6|nr:response regulator [Chachezhania sediminis]